MYSLGTYLDKKNLLPADSNVIKECIEVEERKRAGTKFHCGHDFWEVAKKMDYGEVVHCKRCNQFFAKIKVLPWLTVSSYLHNSNPAKKSRVVYGNNHLATDCYVPVEIRITKE